MGDGGDRDWRVFADGVRGGVEGWVVAVKNFLSPYGAPITVVLLLIGMLGAGLYAIFDQAKYERGLIDEGFIQVRHKGRLIWIKPADVPKLLEIEIR